MKQLLGRSFGSWWSTSSNRKFTSCI